MSILSKIAQISLRVRIFIAMIFLTLVASLLISFVSVYQFKREARVYHNDRLERKDNAVNEHINYILSTTTYPLTTKNLPLIFKDKIYELANIHAIEINIHDLSGKLLISSKGVFAVDTVTRSVNPMIIKILEYSTEKRFVDLKVGNGVRNRTAYTYLKDNKFKSLGILSLPYIEETTFYESGMQNFLYRFAQVYFLMLLITILFAFILSSYVSKPIQIITEKLKLTQLNKQNEKLPIFRNTSSEIKELIISYNSMVDELEHSAELLAQSERENAWREMAKQVAHEIKNPLTPMRLTVQSFERRFNPEDPNINQKLKDYSNTLIQQIDTMSAVASAFSNFASLPVQQNETLNVVYVVQLALEIFNEDYIQFSSTETEIITSMDRTQLIRIITNLVKNATQAITSDTLDKFVKVRVSIENNFAKIEVQDNGKGISIENKSRIFEPKFTTKSVGMGLGLGIIKNIIEGYNGSITFESELNVGTTFTVLLPITLNK